MIVGDRDGAPMVLVPSGSFTMGNDDGQPSEAPRHGVRLSTYYVDQHEVTNRQFRLFLNETHYHGQPPGKWLTDDKARAESELLPVTMVNAHDAMKFAGLGRQAIAHRGAMGDGRPVKRQPELSVGQRTDQRLWSPRLARRQAEDVLR